MSWVSDMQLCGEKCAQCSHNGRSDCRIMFLALGWEQLAEQVGRALGRRSLGLAALRIILAVEPDNCGLREVSMPDMHEARGWSRSGRGGGFCRAIRRLEAAGFLRVVRSDRRGETNLYEVCEPSFASIFGVEYAEMSGEVFVFLPTDIRSDYTT